MPATAAAASAPQNQVIISFIEILFFFIGKCFRFNKLRFLLPLKARRKGFIKRRVD
jgi:hypothetical protein